MGWRVTAYMPESPQPREVRHAFSIFSLTGCTWRLKTAPGHSRVDAPSPDLLGVTEGNTRFSYSRIATHGRMQGALGEMRHRCTLAGRPVYVPMRQVTERQVSYARQ